MTANSIVACGLEFAKNGAFLALIWRNYNDIPSFGDAEVINQPHDSRGVSEALPVLARVDLRLQGDWNEDSPGKIQLRKVGEDWHDWVDVPGLYQAIIGLGLDIRWRVPISGAGIDALRDWVNGTAGYDAVEAYLKGLVALPEDVEEREAIKGKRMGKGMAAAAKRRRAKVLKTAEHIEKKYLPGWMFVVGKCQSDWASSVVFMSPDRTRITIPCGKHQPTISKRQVQVAMGPLRFTAKLTDATLLIRAADTHAKMVQAIAPILEGATLSADDHALIRQVFAQMAPPSFAPQFKAALREMSKALEIFGGDNAL
jgi:hypothetical protein